MTTPVTTPAAAAAECWETAQHLLALDLALVLTDRDAPAHRAKTPLDVRPGSPQPSGWHAHTTDQDTLAAWLYAAVARGVRPGLGVVPGPAGLVVVDVDTTEARERLTEMGEAGGEPLPAAVETPGAVRDGRWAHRGGCHAWCRLPEDYDAEGLPGTAEIAPGVDVKLAAGWAACPPHERSEGPYRWSAGRPPQAIPPAPRWMLEALDRVREARRRPRRAVVGRSRPPAAPAAPVALAGAGFDVRVRAWAEATPWHAVLAEFGWTESGTDACGCPVFRRPGGASPRSGVGHEPGCGGIYASWDSPPLVVWSTDADDPVVALLEDVRAERPERGQVLTRVEVAAAAWAGGDIGGYLRRAGIAGRGGVATAPAGGGGFGVAGAAPAAPPPPPPPAPAPAPAPAPPPAPAPAPAPPAAAAPAPATPPPLPPPSSSRVVVHAGWQASADVTPPPAAMRECPAPLRQVMLLLRPGRPPSLDTPPEVHSSTGLALVGDTEAELAAEAMRAAAALMLASGDRPVPWAAAWWTAIRSLRAAAGDPWAGREVRRRRAQAAARLAAAGPGRAAAWALGEAA